MTPDPIAEVVAAREEARRRKDAQVDVCFLATMGEQGRPEARPVSLRDIDAGGRRLRQASSIQARVGFPEVRDMQTVSAFLEAESYPGPALIIAYSPCIAHGYDLALGADQQRKAVECGVWPLYRFDPRHIPEGKPPLVIDSPPPKISAREYMLNETRFRMVERRDPERFKRLITLAEQTATQRLAVYRHLAGMTIPALTGEAAEDAPGAAR